MQKIVIGLAGLLALATGIGYATNWMAGIGYIVIFLTVVYLRLKWSSKYREKSEAALAKVLRG